MKMISSRQNPLFKRVRDAIRDHENEIVIEGPKAVADAVAAGWKPIASIRRGVEFSADLFDVLAETKSPQNVIGLFARPATRLVDVLRRRDTIAVALDGVQDPGNVGTIIRLAAAFDAAGVVMLPGCADPYSPKSIRASAGAILTVPLAPATAKELMATGLPIFAADAGGGTGPPPARQAILVFGSEGRGLSDAVRKAATPIAIAMSSKIESLNVAASAAILLYRSYAARTS
jgi:TrmH family RNA methyltransferase